MFTFGPASRGGDVDPLYAFVVSMLHCEGVNGTQTYTDVKGVTWTGLTANPPTVSNTTSKFGASSLRFPGISTSQRVQDGSDALQLLGTGIGFERDFCVEFFVRLDTVSGTKGLVSHNNAASPHDWNIEAVGSQLQVRLLVTNNPIIALSGTLVANTWHHVAMTRQGGSTLRLFLDGALLGSVAFTSSDNSGTLGFGCSANGGNQMTGYIDEIRITRGASGSGAARYTAGFTPPAAPYPEA